MSELPYVSLYGLVNRSLGGIGPVEEETLRKILFGIYLVIPGEGRESPSVIMRAEPEWLTVAVALETPEGLARLRNVMNMRGSPVARKLIELMGFLDPRFKTKLQRRVDTPTGPSYTDVRSYVSQKVNAALMGQLLVESEALKQEGLKARRAGSSFTPSLNLAHLQVEIGNPLTEHLLAQVRPLYELISNLRGAAAAPLQRVDTARQAIDGYRVFVGMLNEARRRGTVSSEERRRMEKSWRDEPGTRQALTEELTRLLRG